MDSEISLPHLPYDLVLTHLTPFCNKVIKIFLHSEMKREGIPIRKYTREELTNEGTLISLMKCSYEFIVYFQCRFEITRQTIRPFAHLSQNVKVLERYVPYGYISNYIIKLAKWSTADGLRYAHSLDRTFITPFLMRYALISNSLECVKFISEVCRLDKTSVNIEDSKGNGDFFRCYENPYWIYIPLSTNDEIRSYLHEYFK